MLLTGDVGGTKTILSVVNPKLGPRRPVAEKTYASADYHGLEQMVETFLQEVSQTPKNAVFGVAGPVVRGRSRFSNLPWEIEETALADKLGLQSVRLINDLEAIAWNIPHLHGEDVSQVVTPAQGPDRGAPSGNVAVVAPGTGLGEAFLVWDGKRYVAHACEGGHTDFAPTDAVQLELARFLLDRYPHVSYERVACGSGIPNVYDFFRSRGEPPEPAWLAEKLRAAEDPTPLIIGAALDESVSCPIAEAVLEVFLSVLGAEVGNLALKTNATGGIYLSGGMPRRMLAQLKSKVFLAGLRNKGRMTALVERMPVSVITNPKSALLGAAHFGLEWLQSRQELW